MKPLAVSSMIQLRDASQKSVLLLTSTLLQGNPDNPNGVVSCPLSFFFFLAPDVVTDTEQRGTVLNRGKALTCTQLEGSIHL